MKIIINSISTALLLLCLVQIGHSPNLCNNNKANTVINTSRTTSCTFAKYACNSLAGKYEVKEFGQYSIGSQYKECGSQSIGSNSVKVME